VSAHWATVAKTDLGRALQTLGSTVLHWLKLLQALVIVSMGAMTAFVGGWALLQFDKALPGAIRQFCLGYAHGSGVAGACPLLPYDVATIRNIALGLLLAGLLWAAWGFCQLCHWFLDRR
jgi:hypothetical protein